MESIKIFGTNSSKYQYFKYELNKQLKRSGIEVPVIEINDVDLIIEEKIEAIPTLRINEHIDLVCREKDNVNEFLREAFKVILKEYNYGNMKKILVPMDFSDASINAFYYAKQVATRINGAIVLAHYFHPTLAHSSTNYVEEIEKKFEKMTKPNTHMSSSLQNGTYINTLSHAGFAAEEIVDVSGDFDIVIMGTTGSTENLKNWFGSVSTKVSKESKSPVLLIPPEFSYTEIEAILYPLKKEIRDFDHISWFLESLNPQLHLVHFDKDDQHSPLMRELLGKKADLLKSSSQWDVKYISTTANNVEEGIKNYTKENNIDLLILEKGSEHFFESLVRKSLTNKLAGNIEIPVLVLTKELQCRGCIGSCRDQESKKPDEKDNLANKPIN